MEFHQSRQTQTFNASFTERGSVVFCVCSDELQSTVESHRVVKSVRLTINRSIIETFLPAPLCEHFRGALRFCRLFSFPVRCALFSRLSIFRTVLTITPIRSIVTSISSSTMLPTIPTRLPYVHHNSLGFPFFRLTTLPFASSFLSIGFSKPSDKITATSVVLRHSSLLGRLNLFSVLPRGKSAQGPSCAWAHKYRRQQVPRRICRVQLQKIDNIPFLDVHRQVDLPRLDKCIEQDGH